MNIFAIEGSGIQIDWVKSAQSQDNYRVVKMILESCQMLCTALNELSGEQVTPYRSTHKNHPSSKWVRESAGNFLDLVEHTSALIKEYERRFNKTHKCQRVLFACLEIYDPDLFPQLESTLLPLCMPDEYKSPSIVESYRRFYASKPRIRYPKDKIPWWFNKYRNNVEYQII
jgi:hypothetical protein